MIHALGDKVYFNYEDGVMQGEIINFLEINRADSVVLETDKFIVRLPLTDINVKAERVSRAVTFYRASRGAEV